MKQPVVLIALLAAGTANAADAPYFDAQRLAQHVKTLSSDAFEGRGPNTAGEEKTIAYLIEQFKAAGLQPGGDSKNGNRLWTQAVPLGRFEIKGPVVASVSLGGKVRSLQQGNEIAIRAAMNGQTSVVIKDAPLVFVGYGVKAPERNWDDFKGVDLKGKIAVVLINDPDFESGQGAFGGKAMTYYGRWTYKFEEMARQGAIGTMIVHETAPASYGWPTVKNSNTNVMFDIVRQEPQKSHAPLESWIQRDTAVTWFKQAGLNFDTLKKQAQTPAFKPVTLKGVTFTADYAVAAQTVVSQNVVARIEGAVRPDETVLYTAHWDHLGIGAADAKGDTIYNGANDNALGLAAMLEIASAYGKAPKPARSVVLLAVTAEEKGLLGSEFYASNPLYPLATTAGAINMDGFSPGPLTRDFTISGNAKLELLDRLIDTGKRWNLIYVPDSKPEAGYFFRSDHFPLAKRGVPAISFGSGSDWIVGGLAAGQAARAEYTARKYHQPADEFDPSWTFESLKRDMQVLYMLGRELADSNEWPNWSLDSEFRGARDRSASERKGD
ncbi:M28 family metallopeptidase [Arenimonas sp.]|jgi:Zn-dependent M28 family amino/carboxypeptidase|uniref:M28 family metallopeptidase n=1 Tax=Arenimonas sp. TaxID=1872635 RepID=UPI0037C0DF95